MIPFRFAQLHHFCIPAYTHQIPNGISSHLLRDNLYIITLFFMFFVSPPVFFHGTKKHLTPKKQKKGERQQCATLPY